MKLNDIKSFSELSIFEQRIWDAFYEKNKEIIYEISVLYHKWLSTRTNLGWSQSQSDYFNEYIARKENYEKSKKELSKKIDEITREKRLELYKNQKK